jgi:3D (Asp-Asp-Asp) domain-containing protein
MRRILSRSNWRKSFALIIAILGLLLIFEIEMFDSQYAAFQQMVREDGPPPPGSRLKFSATAYCKGHTTASGVGVRTGIAAADPQILPVGTVLNVATGDARYNGVYTVMDTGPKVQGRILDLYMWSCHEALKFGRKETEVTVLRLGWDPRASSPRLIDRLFRGREARRVPSPEPPPPAGLPPDEAAALDGMTTADAAPAVDVPVPAVAPARDPATTAPQPVP